MEAANGGPVGEPAGTVLRGPSGPVPRGGRKRGHDRRRRLRFQGGGPGLDWDLANVVRSPFQRDGRAARLRPFAAVALLAEASLALPPGPQSVPSLVASLVLLGAVAGAIFLPWDRLPRSLAVCVPLAYLGSVLALTIAAGGTRSGVGLVLLVPVVWTALFHRPWESACVVAALAAAAFLASFFPRETPPATIARRVFFFTAVAVLISVAVHELRARASRSEAATARLQGRMRELSIVADRDRIAASLQDTVVQRLFAAGLSLQGTGLLTREPELAARINAVVQSLDDAVKLLRQSIFGLAHGLPDRGLRRSILDLSNELTPVLGMVPEVVLDGPLDTDVPPRLSAQLLTALREALLQSGTGARASRVAVTVEIRGGEVALTVTDDGIRWGARTLGDGPRLDMLEQLARRIGGTMQVSPAAGGGEQLVWRAPLGPVPATDPPASAPDAA